MDDRTAKPIAGMTQRLFQGDIRIPYVGILPPKFHDHVKKRFA